MSSNIVGYQKIELSTGFNMIGVQFQDVGASTLSRSIASIGTLDSQMSGYDEDYNYATELLVWNPTTTSYTTFGWAGTSGTDVDDDSSYDNQWLDAGTEITDETIDVTGAFWLRTTESGVFTIAGQVPVLSEDKEIEIVSGFNMVANPYPMSVPVSSFAELDSTMSGYDEDYNYSTEMLVWNPATTSYTTYGWAGSSGTDVDGDSSYDNQWLDAGTEITDDTIDPGCAVWIRSTENGTLTFKARSF